MQQKDSKTFRYAKCGWKSVNKRKKQIIIKNKQVNRQ